MKTIISFLLLFTICGVHAQMEIYSSLTIPDSLKKDADVVIRDENIKFTINDINTAFYESHEVLTIFNEQGKRYLSFAEYSDKFSHLENAEIVVFNPLGIKQKTYTKKDMQNEAYGEGLVPEGKITYFIVNASTYPLTIEINFSMKFNGTFKYPSFDFQNPYQSVQHSTFDVEAPSKLSLRYKDLNCNFKPTITKNDDKEFYHWETKNLLSYKLEKHVGLSENFLPKILLAPNKFQLDGFAGDMTSWKNYGIWINDLYSTTTSISEERKIFYQSLVKNANSNEEKAKILYTYMQANMRYVSIQLGIGGLRPFKASFVDEKKYGDCKALSNYLKTALDAVGIKSNVIIIYRDFHYKSVDENFPMDDFNHVILCIPTVKDTTWLECTSTTLPFATLDETTLNRKAILITDSGGVVINTPKSNYKNNTQSFYTTIEFAEDNATKVTTKLISIGEERDNLVNYFHDEKDDERRKMFIHHLQWKQPDFIDITTSAEKENPYVINAKMEYEKVYSFKAGSKYFFMPRLYPIFDEDIPETEKRKLDYYFTYPYQTIDTTVYHLPATFTVESLPKNKNIETDFGFYKCTYVWDANTHSAITITDLQIKERIIKAADYSKLLDFKSQVMADVNEKIVMKKTD